jgi:hypothetical protein
MELGAVVDHSASLLDSQMTEVKKLFICTRQEELLS